MPEKLTAHTRALREEFDQRFTAPRELDRDAPVSMLGLRLGGRAFALRLDALAGLQAMRRLVPLPQSRVPLLGLTGVRGRLVPVFSLAALMELPLEPEANWLVLIGHADPVALAFAELDGYFELPLTILQRAQAEGAPGARSFLLPDAAARQLIDTAALLEAL
ncbi:MAG TPA: chemotaxis protein CheW [Oscillatoriaceae cyanobacterium]